ncbi:MAG: c-type cytochrome [Povalibacter sp.]
MPRHSSLFAMALIAIAAFTASTGSSADRLEAPAWLFPIPATSSAPATALDDVKPLSIPTSDRKLTQAQINNPFHAPDWHPDAHTPMPQIVAMGHAPDVIACAYCHTPTGQGRPENSALAGLSADYIREQLWDMRSGARAQIGPSNYLPIHNMLLGASHLTDGEIDAASGYFSRQVLGERVKVVEATRIPKVVQAAWIYALAPEGGEEELGQRIIEVTPDLTRHERRDDRMSYTAYVRPGSLKRGKTLANSTDATLHCASCHGADLKGGTQGPAIAGRSPTYLARQLIAFSAGTRHGQRAVLMQPVVARLAESDVIALAAYVSSLPP